MDELIADGFMPDLEESHENEDPFAKYFVDCPGQRVDLERELDGQKICFHHNLSEDVAEQSINSVFQVLTDNPELFNLLRMPGETELNVMFLQTDEDEPLGKSFGRTCVAFCKFPIDNKIIVHEFRHSIQYPLEKLKHGKVMTHYSNSRDKRTFMNIVSAVIQAYMREFDADFAGNCAYPDASLTEGMANSDVPAKQYILLETLNRLKKRFSKKGYWGDILDQSNAESRAQSHIWATDVLLDSYPNPVNQLELIRKHLEQNKDIDLALSLVPRALALLSDDDREDPEAPITLNPEKWRSHLADRIPSLSSKKVQADINYHLDAFMANNGLYDGIPKKFRAKLPKLIEDALRYHDLFGFNLGGAITGCHLIEAEVLIEQLEKVEKRFGKAPMKNPTAVPSYKS